MITYDHLAEPLALDLAYLKVSEFVTLHARGGFVQVIQDPDQLRAELMPARPITQDERGWLANGGWREPRQGRPTWVRHAGWPLTAAAALELATSVLDAARVFVQPDITRLEYDAWEPLEVQSLHHLRRAPVSS